MSTSEARPTPEDRPDLQRRPARLWLIALPLVVGVLSIPVAELAYRIAGVRVAATMEGFYEPFGEDGYAHRPGAGAFMSWFSGDFTVNIDGLGFRATQATLEATAPDLLVLGDSQAFGQGLEYADSVIGQLASRAQAAGIRVGNAAVGGHSLLDQVVRLEHLVQVHQIRPRTILVACTPRMLWQAEVTNVAYVHNGALFGGPPTRMQLLRKLLSGRSAVYVTVRNAVRKLLSEPRSDVSSVAEFFGTGAAEDARAAATERVLRRLLKTADRIDARLILIQFPLAIEARMGDLAASQGLTEVDVASSYRSLARAADRLGLPHYDMAPALAATRKADEGITLHGDPHYSATTSARVAALLWESLNSLPDSP